MRIQLYLVRDLEIIIFPDSPQFPRPFHSGRPRPYILSRKRQDPWLIDAQMDTENSDWKIRPDAKRPAREVDQHPINSQQDVGVDLAKRREALEKLANSF